MSGGTTKNNHLRAIERGGDLDPTLVTKILPDLRVRNKEDPEATLSSLGTKLRMTRGASSPEPVEDVRGALTNGLNWAPEVEKDRLGGISGHCYPKCE